MSIFGKIKTAIFGENGPLGGQFGGGKDKPAVPAPAPVQPHAQTSAAAPVQPAPVAPVRQQPVDVEAVLTERMRAKGNPNLNWRTSVADLMRLLDLDPSLDNRKELATELGYAGAKDGSAEMNIWLYKAVMRELAKNGGNVPGSLKD